MPEAGGRDVLADVRMVANRFVAEWLTDAHEVVKLHALDGKFEREVELPTIGSIGGFSGKRSHTESFYSFSSFAYPGVVYRYDVGDGEEHGVQAAGRGLRPRQDYETEQVFYPSKDGTKIPMFITYKKGLKKDGKNPTYLYGYGGFNIAMTPAFSPALICVDGDGRRLRAGQPARRRRVRRGVARGRHAWATSRTSSTTSSPRPSA